MSLAGTESRSAAACAAVRTAGSVTVVPRQPGQGPRDKGIDPLSCARRFVRRLPHGLDPRCQPSGSHHQSEAHPKPVPTMWTRRWWTSRCGLGAGSDERGGERCRSLFRGVRGETAEGGDGKSHAERPDARRGSPALAPHERHSRPVRAPSASRALQIDFRFAMLRRTRTLNRALSV